jgi:hypothetical protein
MKGTIRFATDAALGKLGRHLRAAGFDTRCAPQRRQLAFFDAVGVDRVILTRTMAVKKRFTARPLIFVRSNNPLDQLTQVFGELNIQKDDLRPFSRCLGCNQRVHPVDRQTIKGRVPTFVWQRHTSFHTCRLCRRIYWAGSHHDRLVMQLSALFTSQESNQA